jgi:hypothetical protein
VTEGTPVKPGEYVQNANGGGSVGPGVRSRRGDDIEPWSWVCGIALGFALGFIATFSFFPASWMPR